MKLNPYWLDKLDPLLHLELQKAEVHQVLQVVLSLPDEPGEADLPEPDPGLFPPVGPTEKPCWRGNRSRCRPKLERLWNI
jgi:hypothetical protein